MLLKSDEVATLSASNTVKFIIKYIEWFFAVKAIFQEIFVQQVLGLDQRSNTIFIMILKKIIV